MPVSPTPTTLSTSSPGWTSPAGGVAAYRYDGFGRRIEKQVNGVITRFVYDQEDILALYDATGCWQQTIIHGPGIDQPLTFAQDSNGDCGPFNAAGFQELTRLLHPDGLGSLTSLVTEVGGFFRSLQLAERVTYDNFGTPLITGPGPDGLMDTADDVVLPQSAFGNLYFFTWRE